jgi:hypothetical protein
MIKTLALALPAPAALGSSLAFAAVIWRAAATSRPRLTDVLLAG